MENTDDEEPIEADEFPEYLDLTRDVQPVIAGDTPEWFTNADAYILFVLYTGLTLTPSVIAENTDLSRVTVSRRLSTLHAGGLVEKVGRGKYKITKDGAFMVSEDLEIYGHTSDSEENHK